MDRDGEKAFIVITVIAMLAIAGIGIGALIYRDNFRTAVYAAQSDSLTPAHARYAVDLGDSVQFNLPRGAAIVHKTQLTDVASESLIRNRKLPDYSLSTPAEEKEEEEVLMVEIGGQLYELVLVE